MNPFKRLFKGSGDQPADAPKAASAPSAPAVTPDAPTDTGAGDSTEPAAPHPTGCTPVRLPDVLGNGL